MKFKFIKQFMYIDTRALILSLSFYLHTSLTIWKVLNITEQVSALMFQVSTYTHKHIDPPTFVNFFSSDPGRVKEATLIERETNAEQVSWAQHLAQQAPLHIKNSIINSKKGRQK